MFFKGFPQALSPSCVGQAIAGGWDIYDLAFSPGMMRAVRLVRYGWATLKGQDKVY